MKNAGIAIGRTGLVITACLCAATLLGGCKEYSFLKGNAVPPPELHSFLNDLSDEYRLLGDFAAGQTETTEEASNFYGKASRASAGQSVSPEALENYDIPAFATHELKQARHTLVDALTRANVPENSRMLAMAQVKFDCWLAYQPFQKKEGGYIGCREAFRQAMANVDFTRAAPVVVTSLQSGPQTIHFADETMTLNAESHDMIAALAEQALSAEGTVVLLTGHSRAKATIEDTSNNAVRRIIAVRNALYQNGVDPDLVEVRFERSGSPLDVDMELSPAAAAKSS